MFDGLKPYLDVRPEGWLGEIPEHWAVKRTKHVLRERDARSLDGSEQLLRVSQYTGVTAKHLSESAGEKLRTESLVGYKLVHQGDLVVNIMLAWNGSLGVSPIDGLTSPAYCVYQITDGMNRRYMHYLLRCETYKARIKTVSTGVVESRLRLYTDSLFRLESLVPPLEEQEAIVRFLDWANGRLERVIQGKRRVLALLTEQKQAIIHRAVTRGLDPSVPLKPSGIPWLGEIPAHWDVKPVAQLFSLGRGKVTSHDHIAQHPGSYPLYSSQTLNNGVMGFIDTFMFEGDYLTWTTDGAHAGTVFRRNGRFNCTNVCGTLKPRLPLDLDFMKMAVGLETKRFVRLDINPKLMNNMMARIRVLVPPVDEQMVLAAQANRWIQPFEAAKDRLEREIGLLSEYRTRLIADVVTGKLDVREAARNLPDDELGEIVDEADDLVDEGELEDEEAVA